MLTKRTEDNDYSPNNALPIPLFDRHVPSGRVDLVRTGNAVEATTRGVAAFTLLISPDAFEPDPADQGDVQRANVFDDPPSARPR